MKGKLYLSSIRTFSQVNVPHRFEITRYPKLEIYPQVTQLKCLAPSKRLLSFFKSQPKNNDSLLTYYFQYKQEISNSIEAQKALKNIERLLDNGEDVQLICFCPDYRYCHRTILGQWLERKGYEVIYD